MTQLPLKVLVILFALLLVCVLPTLHSQQTTDQGGAAKKTEGASKHGISSQEKTGKQDKKGQQDNNDTQQLSASPPQQTAGGKLEITKIEPDSLTASDSPQELTLSVSGAADKEKLTVTFKGP